MPSRYSSTYTGTLAPSFRRLVRSLRTILPGKCSTSFASRSSALSVSFCMSEVEVILYCQVDAHRNALKFDFALSIAEHQKVVITRLHRLSGQA